MTQRLELAISELAKLPEPAQDTIATFILDQIADEARWNEAFARTQDQLAELAKRARAEAATGRTHRLSSSKP
jgi:hypothetical protein